MYRTVYIDILWLHNTLKLQFMYMEDCMCSYIMLYMYIAINLSNICVEF